MGNKKEIIQPLNEEELENASGGTDTVPSDWTQYCTTCKKFIPPVPGWYCPDCGGQLIIPRG